MRDNFFFTYDNEVFALTDISRIKLRKRAKPLDHSNRDAVWTEPVNTCGCLVKLRSSSELISLNRGETLELYSRLGKYLNGTEFDPVVVIAEPQPAQPAPVGPTLDTIEAVREALAEGLCVRQVREQRNIFSAGKAGQNAVSVVYVWDGTHWCLWCAFENFDGSLFHEQGPFEIVADPSMLPPPKPQGG